MGKIILEKSKQFDKSNYQENLAVLVNRIFKNFEDVRRALRIAKLPENKVYVADERKITVKNLPHIIETWPIYEQQGNHGVKTTYSRLLYEVARLRYIED